MGRADQPSPSYSWSGQLQVSFAPRSIAAKINYVTHIFELVEWRGDSYILTCTSDFPFASRRSTMFDFRTLIPVDGLDDQGPLRELGGPAGPAGKSRAIDLDPTHPDLFPAPLHLAAKACLKGRKCRYRKSSAWEREGVEAWEPRARRRRSSRSSHWL